VPVLRGIRQGWLLVAGCAAWRRELKAVSW